MDWRQYTATLFLSKNPAGLFFQVWTCSLGLWPVLLQAWSRPGQRMAGSGTISGLEWLQLLHIIASTLRSLVTSVFITFSPKRGVLSISDRN